MGKIWPPPTCKNFELKPSSPFTVGEGGFQLHVYFLLENQFFLWASIVWT